MPLPGPPIESTVRVVKHRSIVSACRSSRIPRAAFLLCALVALAAPAAADELVTNGSFESGPTPGESMPLAMGSTAVPGWIVTQSAIDYVGTLWNAAEGSRSIALNGTSAGGIAQTFGTVPSEEYTVRFCMAGDAFSSPILKHMRVTAAGQSQDYEFDAGHSWPWGMGWLEKTFVFTASGSATTLEFMSLDGGDTGPTLDSVVVSGPSVVDVPTAASAGLALSPPFPNPASERFSVSFSLPAEAKVRLSVCDVQGREVRVLADGQLPAGLHTRTWDGHTMRGRSAAGLYLVRLAAPGKTLVRKVVLTQ